MMTDGPIVFISRNRVRPGQLDGLRWFLAVAVPALEAAKPRTLAFLAYVNEATMTLTVVHVFVNAADFAAHVEGADDRSDAVRAFIDPIELEIHGTPEEATVAAIRAGLPSDVRLRSGDGYAAGFLRLAR